MLGSPSSQSESIFSMHAFFTNHRKGGRNFSSCPLSTGECKGRFIAASPDWKEQKQPIFAQPAVFWLPVTLLLAAFLWWSNSKLCLAAALPTWALKHQSCSITTSYPFYLCSCVYMSVRNTHLLFFFFCFFWSTWWKMETILSLLVL